VENDQVADGRTQILSYLENPESSTLGYLSLGDKSTPAEIWQYFPGMSKGQFKSAVGVLLREGAIQTSPHVLTLVPPADRVPMQSPPYSGKSPKGWRTPANCTLFLGNLPFSATDLDVAEAIERNIGFGKLATVKVSVDKDSGNSRGFGHVDFFASAFLEEALGKLRNLKVEGRAVRVELKKSADEVKGEKEYVTKSSDRSGSDSGGGGELQPLVGRSASSNSSLSPLSKGKAKTVETRFPREDYDVNSWCTVYVGELPYKITDETLKFVIESKLSNGKGSIAAVRQAVNKETGLKRGFGYIDFHEKASAERAVKELNGINVMGRAIKLDLEGMKKRRN
jgi:RNA recognition motif-containing protein